MRCVTFDTNIDSQATGQYKKFNFNSMKKFGDQYIGTSPTGLYVMGGDKDIDVNIDAWVKTGMTDLGIQSNKRLRFLYLGLETAGDLEIEVINDESVVKTYVVKAGKTGQQRIRVAAGRDHKGVYWSFAIKNKKGVHFAIDSIKVLPVILHYGRL